MLKIVSCDDHMTFIKIVFEYYSKGMSLFVDCCFTFTAWAIVTNASSADAPVTSYSIFRGLERSVIFVTAFAFNLRFRELNTSSVSVSPLPNVILRYPSSVLVIFLKMAVSSVVAVIGVPLLSLSISPLTVQ